MAPTLAAARGARSVLLANKESIVMAGALFGAGRPHGGLPAGQQGVQAGAVAALDEQLRTEDLVDLRQGHGDGIADFYLGVGVNGWTSISC